jgi:hypothetical protein
MPDVLLAPLLSLRDDRESGEGGIIPLAVFSTPFITDFDARATSRVAPAARIHGGDHD